RPNQPHRLVLDETFDVMAADQRDMLAKALAVRFDQGAAMPGLLLLHFVKHLGRGGIGFAQSIGKIPVDARVLFLESNRKGKDFLLGEIFEFSRHDICPRFERPLLHAGGAKKCSADLFCRSAAPSLSAWKSRGPTKQVRATLYCALSVNESP